MYRLKQNDIDRLSAEPETGMGYQLIKAAVNSEKKSLFFLFNCELLVSFRGALGRGLCRIIPCRQWVTLLQRLDHRVRVWAIEELRQKSI